MTMQDVHARSRRFAGVLDARRRVKGSCVLITVATLMLPAGGALTHSWAAFPRPARLIQASRDLVVAPKPDRLTMNGRAGALPVKNGGVPPRRPSPQRTMPSCASGSMRRRFVHGCLFLNIRHVLAFDETAAPTCRVRSLTPARGSSNR